MVGYDIRFMLEEYVCFCVGVFVVNGIKIYFIEKLILIFVVLFIVKNMNLVGVIMIIVSYNLL